MRIGGKILWARCASCLAEFPVFVFSGETDASTDRLRATVDVVKKVLFIFDRDSPTPGGVEIELVDVQRVKSVPGESFQEYRLRASRQKEKYFYRCASCTDSAEVIEEINEKTLNERGYKLMNLFDK